MTPNGFLGIELSQASVAANEQWHGPDLAADFWRGYAGRARAAHFVSGRDPRTQRPAGSLGLAQPSDPHTAPSTAPSVTSPPPAFSVQPWLENFLVLTRWEGRVLAVREDTFLAVVKDQVAPANPEEEAEIPIEEVSAVDRTLVKPGAFFYWSIGYRVSAAGQRSRQSVIRFQRLPRWSAEEVERARRTVQESGLVIESDGTVD